jgi:hypothetical protein
MFVTEGPRLAKVTEIPVTELFRSAAPNDLEIPSKLEKDVNLDGTNSTSPLESIEVSKKQTQNGVKTTPKNVLPIGKRAETKHEGDPNSLDPKSTPSLCLLPATTTLVVSKMTERSWNVYENKGPCGKIRNEA